MKTSLKKLFKIFGVFSLIIIAALAVLVIYLNSSAGQNFIKDLIKAQIESSANLKVEIGSLKTNLISYVNVSEITLYPDKKTNSRRLLSLNKFQIKYNFYDLIFGRKINYLLIDSLSLFIYRDSLGIFNLPSISKETDAESDSTFVLPLKVDRAEIQHVNTYYSDDFIPLETRLSNLDIRIEKTGHESIYKIKTSFETLNVSYFIEPIMVSNFSLTGSLKDNLTLMPVSVKGNLSELNFSGSLASDEKTISGDFNLAGDLQNLLTTVSGDSSLDFSDPINTNVKFKIKNYMSSPDIVLNAMMDDYKADKIRLKNINLAGSYRADTLHLTDLSLGISGGTASGSGWMAFDSLLSHEFSLGFHNIDIKNSGLNPAGEYITQPLLADFDLNSEGYLSDISLLKLKSGLRIYTNNLDILNASINLKDSYLSVSSDETPVFIESGIYLNNKGYSGTAEVNLMNPEVLSSLFNLNGVKGTIKTASSLNGTWSVPGFNTSIYSSSIYYNNIKVIDTMSVVLHSNNNEIFIDSSVVMGNITNLDSLAFVVGLNEINGSLIYSLSGKGSAEDQDFILDASIRKPAMGPISFDNADIVARVNIDTISISEFRLQKDSLLVSAIGIMDLSELTGSFQSYLFNGNSGVRDTISAFFDYNSDGDYNGQVSSDKLHLEVLSCFFPELEIDSGELNMDLNFSISDIGLEAYLPFIVSNLKRKNLFVDSVTGAFSIKGDNLLIDSLSLRIGKNSGWFGLLVGLQKDRYGNYFIDKTSRTEGYLYGKSLELNILNPFIEDYADITGFGNLNLQWKGSLNNPHLNGKIDINNGHIYLTDSTKLLSDINGNFNFGDSLISIENMTANFDKKPLTINAVIKKRDMTNLEAILKIISDETLLLDADAKLNKDYLKMNLEANDLDLNMAGVFFPLIRNAEGVLSSRILIDGKLNNPGINGTVSVKNISYNPQLMNLAINNGRITAHIDNSRAVLDSAFFNIGKGSLSADGHLLYENNEIRDINLNIEGSDFMLSEPDYFFLKINDLNLNLSQQDQKYRIGGKVQLGTSRYTKDFELTNLWEIFIAKTEGVIENKTSEEPFDLSEYIEEYQLKLLGLSDYFKRVNLDLLIENSDSIWVENNVAKFRIHPDLALRGSMETPILSGRVTVEEDGKIILLDREFDLKEGIVEFDNPIRINPHLNISAESEVTGSTGFEDEGQDYLINLKLEGPLDDFDFTMSSDPPLDNIDIISLLTLGMTYQQLEASQDVNSALKERAGVLTTLELSNKLNNYYQELFGDVLEIDRIGIGGNLFNPGETRFEITKKWADRVEISYSTAVDNLERQILKAKLKLIKYFYLEGRTDQQYESGIDLKFHIKFK